MAERQSPKQTLVRRRRANVGRRVFTVQVSLTAEEKSLLTAMAEQQQVTVPRLLVESALAERDTPGARRQALRDVFAMQRTLTGAATNLNQLAKRANEEERLAVGTAEGVAEIRRAVDALNEQLRALAVS